MQAKHGRQQDKLRSLNKVIKPNADIQKQTLEAAGDHSDGKERLKETDDASESDSRRSDGGEDAGKDELALKILVSRNK